jgi:hypothetical protein
VQKQNIRSGISYTLGYGFSNCCSGPPKEGCQVLKDYLASTHSFVKSVSHWELMKLLSKIAPATGVKLREILMIAQWRFIAIRRFRQVEKPFKFLLLGHTFIETCNNVQNCTFFLMDRDGWSHVNLFWTFGLRPSSGILKDTKEHNVSETVSVSVLRWGVGNGPNRAVVSHP